MSRIVGSRMGAPNVKPPIWLQPLQSAQPTCFTAREWAEYVDGVRRDAVADKSLAKQLERGRMVAVCADCTMAHRAAMQAKGLCNPPPAELPAAAAEVTS